MGQEPDLRRPQQSRPWPCHSGPGLGGHGARGGDRAALSRACAPAKPILRPQSPPCPNAPMHTSTQVTYLLR